MSKIVDIARVEFYQMLEKHPEDRWALKVHVPEMEKWAKIILPEYPDADSEVIMLAIWLHDIGHYPLDGTDHAVRSEKMADQILGQEIDSERKKAVLHCIRSHRSKDVIPDTLEAKLVATLDSISHFTYAPYIDAARDGRLLEAIEKLERDYQDLDYFPELKDRFEAVYEGWSKLLNGLKENYK